MNHTINTSLQRVAPWVLPVLLLTGWQVAVETGLLSSRILPAPSAVLEAGWSLVRSGELWQHLAISSWRASIGFAIGGGIGLLLGFITGLSTWGERLLDSSVQMVRNVPHLALIPLVILWFGIDESAKIFLVALGTFSRSTSIPITAFATSIRPSWKWRAVMGSLAIDCSRRSCCLGRCRRSWWACASPWA